MTITSYEGRASLVLSELLDLDSRVTLLSRVLWQNMQGAMSPGQSLQIMELGDLTVEDAVDTNGAPQNLSVQSLTTTANLLTVDQSKGISAELGNFDREFTLNGNFPAQVAETVLKKMTKKRDTDDQAYLSKVVAWDTSGTYHANVAGDALSIADITTLMAAALDQDGVSESDLSWAFNSYGLGSVMNMVGWQANEATMNGSIGMDSVGKLLGIPVYRSKSVPRNITTTTSAAVVTSNAMALTVPALHGFVPGMMVTVSGLSSGFNIAVAVAIASVGATTITVPLTHGDGTAGDGVGVVTGTSCMNGLFIRSRLWEATVPDWNLRVIPYGPQRVTDIIQAKLDFGRKARAGAAWILHSPGSATA